MKNKQVPKPVPLATKEYRRQWMKDHRAELSEAQRQRRKVNPYPISEKEKERKRIWYVENKKRISELKKTKYRDLKLEDPTLFKQRAARMASYSKTNRPRFRVAGKKWATANPGKVIDSAARRRCDVRHSSSKEEQEAAKLLICKWKSQRIHICSYCDKEVSSTDMHIDHILPIRAKGRHVVENLCVSCADCNRSKSAKIIGISWFPVNYPIDMRDTSW